MIYVEKSFLGWARGSTAINPSYFAGDLVSTAGLDGDVTLFAVWKKDLPTRLISPDLSVFWCQTGGWWGLDGGIRCAPTAIATMASINTSSEVRPNEHTDWNCTWVIINNQIFNINKHDEGIDYIAPNYYEYEDFFKNGIRKGFNSYKFKNEFEILQIINHELNHNRSIVVMTNGYGMHWVTITKTTTSKDATKFDELMGIDPWFNGFKPPNKEEPLDDFKRRKESCGVHIISGNGIQNQNMFHEELRVFTINFD